MRPTGWPSLRGWVNTASSVPTRRAVYGKVHRAPTDYRWIAWSDGFGEGPAPLERNLALGNEEISAPLCCWRHAPEWGGVAITVYPSRAFDAAGRPGGIETQVLASRTDEEIPPAALAFLLLPEAAQFEDTVWWDSWRDPRWSTLSYHLPIPEEQCPSPAVQLLEQRLDEGLRRLFECVAEGDLADFYGQLLAGVRPAVLRAPDGVLPPNALAALLLPLDRELTERLSLAGGVLAKSFDPQRLSHWGGVICTPNIVMPEVQPLPAESVDVGWELVHLLQEGLALGGALPLRFSPGGNFLIGFLESEERWIVPGGMGLASLEQTGPWPVVHDVMEARLLRERVASFVAHSQNEADDARRRHLETKADLLRALLLALCPGPESLRSVARPCTTLVPALYFASRIEPRDWPELGSYSEIEFDVLVRESLQDCTVGAMVQPVADWLRRCADSPECGRLSQYARRYVQPITAESSPAVLDWAPAQWRPVS